MLDMLLTRVGPKITKPNTTYRDAIDPDLKLALTLRHLASGIITQFHMNKGYHITPYPSLSESEFVKQTSVSTQMR